MYDFEVEVRHAAGALLVTVAGELDIATAPQLAAALEQGDGLHLVVDLRPTTFVDSTGVSVLFRALKRGGGRMGIVCTTDNVEVRRVFDLMGLNQVFAIHETLAAAGWEGGESA